MSSPVEDLLAEAQKLPLAEQKELSARLSAEINNSESQTSDAEANLRFLDELFGKIKGLDRETIIWLAEDEELCGY